MTARSCRLTAERLGEIRERVPRAFARPALELAQLAAVWTTLALFVAYCLVRFDIDPLRIWNGFDRLGNIVGGMFPPSPGSSLRELLSALLQSIGMAFLGTLIASIVAVPFGFMGARNMLPIGILRFLLRRHFDFLRGVDALVWALVYVRAVGLGPLAGVLAIATSDVGTLSKLFAEAIENTERKQIDGVRASGGNPVQSIRLGVLPQVLPMMLSSALYMFESNTRSATILGIVGAGGIGFQLSDRIRAHRWDEVAFIVIMIVVAVALIDLLSHCLRRRFVNGSRDT